MDPYTGEIQGEDAKGSKWSFNFYMLPQDVNGDPVSIDACWTVLNAVAFSLLFFDLTDSKVTRVSLTVGATGGSWSSLNTGRPRDDSDIEEKAILQFKTVGGGNRTYQIAAVNREHILSDGSDVIYEDWDTFVATLSGNAFGLPGQPKITDYRGDVIDTSEDFKFSLKWGK